MASNGAPAAFEDTAIKTNEFDVERDIVHASHAEMLANLAAVKAAILKEPEVLKYVPVSVQMQMLDVVRVLIDDYPGNLGNVAEAVQLEMLDSVRDAIRKQPIFLMFVSERVQLRIVDGVAAAVSKLSIFAELLRYVPLSVQVQMIPTIQRCIRESPECIQYLPAEIQLQYTIRHAIGEVVVQNPQNFVFVAESVHESLVVYLAKAAGLHPLFYDTLSKKIRDNSTFIAVYEPYRKNR